jgi:hypothetical protein
LLFAAVGLIGTGSSVMSTTSGCRRSTAGNAAPWRP